jgi:hypothetical protein
MKRQKTIRLSAGVTVTFKSLAVSKINFLQACFCSLQSTELWLQLRTYYIRLLRTFYKTHNFH